MIKYILLVILILALNACTSVMPWEKDKLAKESMSLEGINQQINKIEEHVYYSKDGTKGGGGSGGGCGCN